MNRLALVKSTIINGANTIAVAMANNIVYRLQPIEVMKEIKINNFEANKIKTIFLSDYLSGNYKIVGVTVDFPTDDNENFTTNTRNLRDLSAFCFVRIFNRSKSTENIVLNLTPYPPLLNTLYINHEDTWKIVVNRDITKITFRCVPALIETPVNIP